MKSIKNVIALLLLFFCIAKVTAQEITVFPGSWGYEFYQDDKKISKEELKTLFSKDTEIQQYWKKYQTNKALAYVALIAEVGFAVWAIHEIVENPDDFHATPTIATLGSAVLAGIFIVNSNNNLKAAVLNYNKKFDDSTSELSLGLGKYGVGLTFRF